MNPRDEKILQTIKKKQQSDYGNLVPFCIIQREFLWIDGTELTYDLLNLCKNGYLHEVNDPSSNSGWWYCLTPEGTRECERIKYDSSEKRKNRNVQILSSVISAVLGTILGIILKTVM